MAYVYKNPNPRKKLVGDCVIRGISILTGKSWRNIYVQLLGQGYDMYDMPSSNDTELDRAYKAVDIIKDIKTIEAMEDYTDDGYSGRRYYYDDDMKYARRSMDDRRSRDMMNRYNANGGYSGNDDKEEMMRELEELRHKIENM